MTPQTPTPEPESPALSEGFLIGLALLFAAIIVGGGLFLWQRSANDAESVVAQPEATIEGGEGTAVPTTVAAGETEATDASDPAETETTEPLSGGVACPEGTAPVICESVAFVEISRGRPFQTFPPVELADDETFAEMLLVDFEEEAEELDAYGDILRSLGLAPEDADITAQYRDLLEVGVVGFYDPRVGNLVVRGGELNLYAQSVLVHELVHAHDDQWIGIDRPELDDAEDERSAGFLAIQEGNAERVSEQWLATLTTQERGMVDAQGAALFEPDDIVKLLSLPEFLVSNLQWPYIDGLILADRIFDEGGEAAIEEAFNNPPLSSEQIVHPDLYLAGEEVLLTPIPDYAGELIDDGVFGELGFRFWFSESVGQGWGSDHYVTYREADGSVCTRIDLVADDDAELDEFRTALTNWANESGDRSVEEFGVGLRATGCVG